MNAWRDFKGGKWQDRIDVRDFIQKNYTPYTGDESFLQPPTARTEKMLEKYEALCRAEQQNGGVLNIDTETVITATSFGPGYLDKENEIIVGLQTDEPLKRACNPFGGMRMVRSACEAYGYKVSDKIEEEFKYHKTHNDGVFSAYTDDVRAARHAGIITGLPDAYGRGRIIGDYRRVPLYGVNRLILQKQKDKADLGKNPLTADTIRLSEEVTDQITALKDMVKMAAMYGYDITRPAENAREAVQWLYFAYLAAIKEQNGAAMSLGRTSTFLDIYFERDLKEGVLDESGAQEIMDDFVLKLRMARHLRTPEYNELFGGDPMWITESLGGTGRTAARSSPKTLTACSIRSITSTRPRSRTSPCCGRSTCRKTGSASSRRSPAIPMPSSTRATPLCAPHSVMITPLPAASPPCASAKICSSSVRAQTLQSSYCSPSTAAWTK